MAAAMSEIFLAIFTTLAPFGVGAFILLAFANCFLKLDDVVQVKLDKLMAVPFVVVCVSFIASIMHLTSPLAAINIFTNIGSSPLSNEIAVGAIFFVVAAVLIVMGFLGKLSASSRKWLLIVTAVLGAVFLWFIGVAYHVNTIPSWTTVLSPVEMLCFGLFGGAALGYVVLNLAGALGEGVETHKVNSVMFVMALVGFVGGAVALLGHEEMVSQMWNPLTEGVELAAVALPYIIAFALIGLVALIALGYVAFAKKNQTMAYVALALILVAIFVARLAFYIMQISIAL